MLFLLETFSPQLLSVSLSTLLVIFPRNKKKKEKKKKMGLENFLTAGEGVLPVLVMNSVLSVTLLKNMVRSVFQVIGASNVNSEEEPDHGFSPELVSRERRISITQFKSLCLNRSCGAKTCADIGNTSTSSSTSCCNCSTCICTTTSSSSSTSTECCVCLCGFEDEEDVSELSCKHFFHKGCLDKWFDNKHTTCPLCRSID